MPRYRNEWSSRAAVMMGARIRFARALRGMTIAELSRRVELPATDVQRWEAGVHLMRFESVCRAAHALGVEVSWLLECLDLAGTPPPMKREGLDYSA